MSNTSPSFLPFDNVWKMRIEHPYSLVVKDGALLWSCGQCPLDREGAVLFPGNLLAQAEAVAGFIERYLNEMQCATTSIGRLVVYYVKTAHRDAARLRGLFHRAFGQSVHVIPVAVPHFYYDGMVIEVDVFASDEKTGNIRLGDEQSGLTLDVSDADADIMAELTFTKAPVSECRPAAEAEAQSTLLRMGGGYFHLAAVDASPDRGLVEQTARIMKAVEAMFVDTGLSFRDVRKATTCYIASSSADDLHANMSVRNRYYLKPGPASTGLPVEGLLLPGAKVSVSLFGVVSNHGR